MLKDFHMERKTFGSVLVLEPRLAYPLLYCCPVSLAAVIQFFKLSPSQRTARRLDEGVNRARLQPVFLRYGCCGGCRKVVLHYGVDSVRNRHWRETQRINNINPLVTYPGL